MGYEDAVHVPVIDTATHLVVEIASSVTDEPTVLLVILPAEVETTDPSLIVVEAAAVTWSVCEAST